MNDRWIEPDIFGQCDCCEKFANLSRCWAGELETFACDQCRGFEEDDQQTQQYWEQST